MAAVAELILDLLSLIFLAGGLFFLMVGTVGLLRLPDVYTRLHAVTKCDTLGVGLVLISLLLQSSLPAALKLGLIIIFVLITNPTSAHVIAKAAYVTGFRPLGDQAGDERGVED